MILFFELDFICITEEAPIFISSPSKFNFNRFFAILSTITKDSAPVSILKVNESVSLTFTLTYS